MRRRAAGWLALVLGLGGLVIPPGAAQAEGEGRGHAPQLVFLAWDGAADWAVDRLLEEGEMPNLAALAAAGARAEYSVTSFPSKTAAAHATLWTGCGPACNGVVANSVPLIDAGNGQGTLLESRRGFSSEALTAEPIYVTAAKAGRRVLVLSATQSYPETPHVKTLTRAGVPADRYRSFSGFEHRIAGEKVLGPVDFKPVTEPWPGLPAAAAAGAREAELAVGDSRIFALVYDDPADRTSGFDTLLLRLGSRSAEAPASDLLKPHAAALEPNGWSIPFRVRRGDRVGNTFFRLFDLAPDGSRLVLYQRKASALKGAATAAELEEYLAAYPGFHDEPLYLYEAGAFGAPLMAGGDGSAEKRALELVAFDLQLVTRGTLWAIDRWRPDLVFHYSPMTDQAGHVWVALLDPTLPGHDPVLAARIWPYYARVYHLLDRWLGAIRSHVGPQTVIAIASDHGMAGVHRDFFANRALEEAGLLARTEDDQIDLAHTVVLMPHFGEFSLNVNLRGLWRGGIVAPEDKETVLRRASAALLAVRDPEGGTAVVERLFRPDRTPSFGLGGPRSGDLYFDLAPGYYARHGLSPQAVVDTRRPWGGGEHGFWPQRRDMHAIFYLAGKGVPAGVKLPGVRHIDVAPTLSALLGIPAPAQATGRVIAEAIESDMTPLSQ